MNRLFYAIVTIVLAAGFCRSMAGQSQQAPQPLKLVQKIPLPAVKGRIDHISVDVQGKRLFLAALGNGTMEVIDLAAGTPLRTITGFKDALGALFVSESNLIFISDGELGVCHYYVRHQYGTALVCSRLCGKRPDP
jgi:hypothetical protein